VKNFFKNFFKRKKKVDVPKSIRFNAVSVNNLPPTSKGTSIPSISIKKLKPKALSYVSSRTITYGGEFLPPEYDLAEVGVVEDVESIVRQANRKKIALMYKEGYDFVGKNLTNIQYIKERLHQISIASDIPTAELLRGIGTSLIRLSNAFLLKVRNTKSSGGSIRTTPEGKKLNPVAGYFHLPAETMRMKVNQRTGEIIKWRQEMPDGRYIDYNPDDIVHFYIHRKDGFIFGTPDLVPVIDDIRALRKIEENVELLIYQHIFPLFHYTVGTETAPAGYTEDGTKEIDAVKDEIQYMPSEGGIVTPERHKIELIGSEGRALRAESYLQHFKMRVIAGLGISEMDLGVGNCYDEKTETLTEYGWRKYNEIDDKTKIATYNPETQNIEFHIPNYKYVDYYKGDMLHFTGKHLDIFVTPHHRMWVSSRWTNKWEIKRGYELYEGLCYKEFQYMDAAPFKDTNTQDDVIILPASPKKHGKAKDFVALEKDFASLMGYFVSEGSLDISGHYKSGSYKIVISQNPGNVFDNIESCLNNIGCSFTKYFPPIRENRSQEGRFIIYSKALFDYIYNNIGHLAENKNLPSDWRTWSFESRKNLLLCAIDGDGHSGYINHGGRSRTYYTVSSQLADDIQELALSLGLSAKKAKTKQSENGFGRKGYKKEWIYRVNISGVINSLSIHKNGSVYKHISKKQYEGMIYCFNVPNHLFITRRNGKIAIQGNTANRGTARSLSRQLIDTVKAVQDTLEAQFNQHIINELLLESTLATSTDILDQKNLVHLQFREIDIENKMEMEKHTIELFKSNGIIYSEFRSELGKEPIEIPDNLKENNPSKYPDWHQTYWKLFSEPEQIIRSIDEGWIKTGASSEDEKPKPVAVRNSIRNITDARMILDNPYRNLESEIVSTIVSSNNTNLLYSEIENIVNNWKSEVIVDFSSFSVTEFIQGFDDETFNQSSNNVSYISKGRKEIVDRCSFYINKLSNNILDSISNLIGENRPFDKVSLINSVRSIFSLEKYRVEFISDVETRKAYHYGTIIGMKSKGIEKLVFLTIDESCDKCKSLDGKEFNIDDLSLNNCVPIHPNCNCVIQKK